MNESLERALNEVSILKKTLNSQKTSHQNTLQQLQTTYQIIEEMKEMLKSQQDKNKSLSKQLKEKNQKIQEISREYEDQIMDIKELIERKDLQIKKYTQIKVTDYDMIRFRVINEVQAQHYEELELLKKQIQKQQFINNQSIYENKVLKQKNYEYGKEIEQMKQFSRTIEQQLSTNHTRQLNKVYGLLEQQKLTRRQLQKRIEKQKQKYNETIKKYHKQLETLQSQLMNQNPNKQNHHRHSNVNNSFTLIQTKESQFALQNQKLKRQIKQKSEEIDELTRKHKSETRQFNRRIDELEKQLNESQYNIKKIQEQFKQSKNSLEQEITNKWKRELQKKQKNLKENYEAELQIKDKQLQKLKRQIEQIKNQSSNETYKFGPRLQDEKQDNFKLQRENQELRSQMKKTATELVQLKNKNKEEEYQNRQTRAVSVQDVKDKLKVANAKIVTLLKDKIVLNDKIARLSENNEAK